MSRSGLFPSAFRQAFPDGADEAEQRQCKSRDQGRGAVIHQQQIPHFQIGMIAQQGRKLDQQGDGKAERYGKGKGQGQGKNVRRIEIPLMHVRQKEGDADRKQQAQRQDGLVVHPVPIDP